MCGRTACTLAPDQICQACCFTVQNSPNSDGKNYVIPQWQDHPGDYTYFPSPNIAPSKVTPILFRDSPTPNVGTKRDNEGNFKDHETKYVVQPMMWGIIPLFFKGESPKGHGYTTNNCRLEDIETKRMFKPSLTKGQRCVVVCDGFYEWQSTKPSKGKQPYLIHAPQKKGIEIWNKESWPEDLWNDKEGWKGAALLKMAGLYSVWTSSKGETFYSYTVITMEADKKFNWIHHRIPAILESQKDVEMWLNEDDYKKALSHLRNSVSVESYPVSSSVNNSRTQEPTVMIPVDLSKKETKASSGSRFMSEWLKSASQSQPQRGLKDKVKDEIKDEIKDE